VPSTVAAARRAHALLSAVAAALVLVQAAMAGRAVFGSWSIAAHGAVGNVTFALALLLIPCAVIGRLGRQGMVVSALFAVVLTAQIGLGYVGRENADAAAWHVPNGVLAFGVAVYQVTSVPRGRLDRERSDVGRK